MIFICAVALTACTSGYEKADRGYEYKVIPGSSEKKLQYGSLIKYHLKQMYKNGSVDTVIGDTRDYYMPRIQALDSSNIPPMYHRALFDAGSGDSIVLRIASDSAYNKPGREVLNFIKPGGYVYTTFKILDVYENKDQADSANRAELRMNAQKMYNKRLAEFEKKIAQDKMQIEADSKKIGDWLEKNHIQYTRGKWGTFIVIHNEGTGRKIAYNDVVGVEYTGKTFDSGKVFNSNIDPKFNDLGLYEVAMGNLGSVMPGWTDALILLREGAKATLYIPSSLAYGKRGFLKQIKPDENIVFDIEIKKVITEDRALEIVSENRRRAEAEQRRMNDTMKKKPVAIPGTPFN